MAIADRLTKLTNDIKASYKELEEIGVEGNKNTDNLPSQISNTIDKYKSYIPQATSEGICENALPLKSSVEVDGNLEQEILPKEYQQIEYIENASSSYIDTNVIPTKNTKIQTEVMNVGNTTSQYPSFLGSQNTNNGLNAFVLFDNFNARVGASGTLIGLNKIVVGEFKRVELSFNKIIINQVEYTGNLEWGDNPIRTLYLFTRNSPDPVSYYNMNARMKYLKIFENDILIRNFIPCYRKSDNVIGLYDLVNGVFYVNQGTGTFLKGKDVPNSEYPQDIEVVDNGYNSFDINKTPVGIVVGSYTVDKNSITVVNNGQWRNLKYEYETKIGETYNIKFDYINNSNSYIGIVARDSSQNVLDHTTYTNESKGTKELSFIATTKTSLIYLYSNASETVNDYTVTFENIQLTEGTEQKPYLPYGHIGLRQSGKNVYDKKVSYTNRRLSTSNGSTYSSTGYSISDFIEINLENNYYISDIEEAYQHYYCVYGINKNFIYGGATTGLIRLRDGYNAEDIRYIKFDFKSDNIDKIQLEENSVATPYEPYHEQKTYEIDLNGNWLGKIGDIKDLLTINEKGIVKLEKKIARTFLSGNESWQSFGGDNTYPYRFVNNYVISGFAKNTAIGISNYFSKWYAIGNTKKYTEEGIGGNDSANPTLSVYVKEDTIGGTTTTDFKNWLSSLNQSGNPLAVYVERKDTLTIELPTTEPIKMFEGTNIFELITNIDTDYKIEYYYDYKAIQEQMLLAEPEI